MLKLEGDEHISRRHEPVTRERARIDRRIARPCEQRDRLGDPSDAIRASHDSAATSKFEARAKFKTRVGDRARSARVAGVKAIKRTPDEPREAAPS